MDVDHGEDSHKRKVQVRPTVTETLGPMLVKLAAELDTLPATS